jgi:putative serine protease PepD
VNSAGEAGRHQRRDRVDGRIQLVRSVGFDRRRLLDPVVIVKRIADELIANGAATHGLLGAMVGNAADQEGATTSGRYISEAPSAAPPRARAEEGRRRDVFNGFPITDATDLTAQVRALAAGERPTSSTSATARPRPRRSSLGTLTQ